MSVIGQLVWTIHHALPGPVGWGVIALSFISTARALTWGLKRLALELIDAATEIADRRAEFYTAMKRCRLAKEELGELDLLSRPASQRPHGRRRGRRA